MKVVGIKVQGLFGFLNRTIDLKVDHFATIIHAPNGYGKTTILELVDGLLRLDLAVLSRHLFSRIDLRFDDGSVLSLTKNQFAFDQEITGTRRSASRSQLSRARIAQRRSAQEAAPDELTAFQFTRLGAGDAVQHSLSLDIEEVQDELQEQSPMERRRSLEQHLPWVEQIAPGRYYDAKGQDVLPWQEVIARYADELPSAEWATSEDRLWLRKLSSSVATKIIKTRRLDAESGVGDEADPRYRYQRDIPGKYLSVEKYAREVAEQIGKARGAHSIRSQSIERTLPLRLVEMAAKGGGAPNDAVVRRSLNAIHEKYSRLVEAGILPKEGVERLPGPEKKILVRRILTLIAKDQMEKLSVFDPLLARIETVKDLVNGRYQHKQIQITAEDGYVVKSAEGRRIPLGRLSSGEQHQLVLFHELLFSMRPESLVMIDEPEISLHVAWQEQFLRDLERIGGNTGVHFLIATHSPVIIGNRWDLTEDLGKQ